MDIEFRPQVIDDRALGRDSTRQRSWLPPAVDQVLIGSLNGSTEHRSTPQWSWARPSRDRPRAAGTSTTGGPDAEPDGVRFWHIDRVGEFENSSVRFAPRSRAIHTAR
jgi:hypothetical protein